MIGWYESYSYVGIMPDGSKRRFVSDAEYTEAYQEIINESAKTKKESHC